MFNVNVNENVDDDYPPPPLRSSPLSQGDKENGKLRLSDNVVGIYEDISNSGGEHCGVCLLSYLWGGELFRRLFYNGLLRLFYDELFALHYINAMLGRV